MVSMAVNFSLTVLAILLASETKVPVFPVSTSSKHKQENNYNWKRDISWS